MYNAYPALCTTHLEPCVKHISSRVYNAPAVQCRRPVHRFGASGCCISSRRVTLLPQHSVNSEHGNWRRIFETRSTNSHRSTRTALTTTTNNMCAVTRNDRIWKICKCQRASHGSHVWAVHLRGFRTSTGRADDVRKCRAFFYRGDVLAAPEDAVVGVFW